ncbi:hypothetical protein U729_1546 [Clostridium baratii str. Sullivan]|uniref:Uncharacterized protein n=1 Tax=Clostridium baratii str. Sullivan TaxID=1415775 RepID=A0A0A7FY22_9CLOT|nr:hypothetical protein [Clostridium baratii]AIY83721.1 hypothetical protein U729_1546 [Clostridium baratii str. Sullivan]
MELNETLDFSIEKVEFEAPKMDNTKVQGGCWGDSGSDYANLC